MVARTNGRRLERVVERIGITSEAYSYGGPGEAQASQNFRYGESVL